MKRIKAIIPIVFIFLTLLWFTSEDFARLTWSYFSIRGFIIQYSGILAISAMSIAMILAVRLNPLEKFTQGLDKSYRLHKWLGISCLIVAVIHWFWAKGTKYMVALGLLEKPSRNGNVIGSGLGEGLGNGLHNGAGLGNGRGSPDLTTIKGVFSSLRHLAESVGEWGFYLLVLLIIIALLKSIRYSKFLNTHKIMPVVYLLFAFHTIILTKFTYWQAPIGWVIAILIAGGCWAAIYSLCGRIGKQNKVQGKIEKFHFYKHNRVLDITINTQQSWRGHHPGQFAFVQFKGEEAHPFTIGSVKNVSGRIRFQIKGIGDFTNNLNQNLKINDEVIVEGPYGYFNFKSKTNRQIWVAGGIGIAAFTAQMESLAENPQLKAVDLFYCTQCPDRDFIEYIQTLAKQANVNFYLMDTNVDGFLTAEHICDEVHGWEKADIWFCGPSNFAKILQNRFAQLGLKGNSFHNELFEMR
ncbi:ferric reductase-like transmembrane domain-containing protein [Psychromonas antarctica]|jgi:predicted ferric reductase|uniref:ferredoxin reductase family protein n=1 Tax=Psychromonas antarctica TaxID=67573 RepID=UPI001EE89A3D|nr:ferric reductase-like transmembrane domain-containing protein [Psychromonas antarctica]MCG6200288.1 ferric reductase-like transmembrane domain-containing protein [Psychromonas antarctica]